MSFLIKKNIRPHTRLCLLTYFPLKTGEKIFYLICVQALDVALKAALKGELEDVVLGLLRTPAQYDAQQLKQAMKVMQDSVV